MRKTVFLYVLIIALLAMISFAYAADTEVVIYGQKYIDSLPAGATVEGLFAFELLYDDWTPVIDRDGTPVVATNGPDGSFALKAQIDTYEKAFFYVREMTDYALSQEYIMDIEAHPVTVEPDGNGGFTVSPDPIPISNKSLPPETGDNSPLISLIALNVLSALAIVTLILRCKYAQ